MKKALSRIVSLLLVLCLVTALVPAVFAADENEVQILFLDTSDVHGQQFATDYTQDASLSGTRCSFCSVPSGSFTVESL